MTPSQFLVRGLLAGLIAGLAAFGVAYVLGEPSVNTAIRMEQSHTSHETHPADADITEVSRATQSTWGLLTATVAIGVALGGVTALASAFAMGRLGRLNPAQSTAVVSGVGFVAVSVIPFLKYPATPPAVGHPETLNERTGLFFAMLGISVVAAIAATAAGALIVKKGRGAYFATVVPAIGFIAVVGLAAVLLPTVNEVGDFPADTLWFFHRASILSSAAIWGVLGVVLTGLIGRLHARESAAKARRDLAATL